MVGGSPWVDVCREWLEAFAAIFHVAWKDDFLSLQPTATGPAAKATDHGVKAP